MLKAKVLAYYDNSPVAVARALQITRSAVNQWPEIVPLRRALKLNAITHGELSVDMEDYDLQPIPNESRSGRQTAAI
jgi:hypothetical protein